MSGRCRGMPGRVRCLRTLQRCRAPCRETRRARPRSARPAPFSTVSRRRRRRCRGRRRRPPWRTGAGARRSGPDAAGGEVTVQVLAHGVLGGRGVDDDAGGPVVDGQVGGVSARSGAEATDAEPGEVAEEFGSGPAVLAPVPAEGAGHGPVGGVPGTADEVVPEVCGGVLTTPILQGGRHDLAGGSDGAGRRAGGHRRFGDGSRGASDASCPAARGGMFSTPRRSASLWASDIRGPTGRTDRE